MNIADWCTANESNIHHNQKKTYKKLLESTKTTNHIKKYTLKHKTHLQTQKKTKSVQHRPKKLKNTIFN